MLQGTKTSLQISAAWAFRCRGLLMYETWWPQYPVSRPSHSSRCVALIALLTAICSSHSYL